METITSPDGTAIAYWRSGQGPPLLLVHGGLSDRGTWALVQPALEQQFTVYAMNRRGREGSDAPRHYALEREFEDVAAVIGSIDQPVHLVGQSSGALCSLGAARLTDRVRSLVLYEPPTPGTSRTVELANSAQEAMDRADPDAAATTFLSQGPGLSDEEISQLKQSPIWPDILALASTLPMELEAIAGYQFVAANFAGLTVPTLLLLGSDSPALIRVVTHALAEVLANAQVTELAGQQHVAHLAAPDLFLAQVVSFMAAA